MLVRYSTNEKGNLVKKAIIYTKEEHSIKINSIDSDALYIIDCLKNNGFDSYIVGGAVRDLIEDRAPKDFDIVTDATPSRIKKIFRNSRIIGKRFRLVHVFFGEKIFEVSTFRSIVDGSVGNSFGSMDEDVLRRDFTLNALYYDPIKQQIIDYVGGFEDIKKGIVRPVIPLDRIFIEDPVRMLRAVKYGAMTGCKIPHKLKKKIRLSAPLLSPISPSRLTEELLKIINSGHSYEIITAALETDLYVYLQPSATNLMLENKKYAKAYLENLKQLDTFVKNNPESRLGERLYFLIKDFIEHLTNWELESKNQLSSSELYKKTWAICRNFVLPMNPQRTELDYAIRKVLISMGIQLKTKRQKSYTKKNIQELPV